MTVPSASPERLRWDTESGFVETAFADVDTLRLRGEGLALKLKDAAVDLTSFTGSFLYTSPLDGLAVFTSYETGRRYRITSISGDFAIVGSELLGAGERSVFAGADGGAWEIADQEVASEPEPDSASRFIRRGRRGRAARVRRVRRRRRPVALGPSGRDTRRLRPVVGDGSPTGVRHARDGADVEALDGQGVELGPLLQRSRPRPIASRTRT